MRHAILLPGLLALVACAPAGDRNAFADPMTAGDSAVAVMRGAGPPDADPLACYGRKSIPAVIETVTEQIMLQPPQPRAGGTGDVEDTGRDAAILVTQTQQRIVRERRDLWFEVPCALEAGDAEFIASLQRALKARGLYEGPITGTLTQRTGRAIRAFQAPQGLDSEILSLAAAKQLGLALWNPELAGRGTGG